MIPKSDQNNQILPSDLEHPETLPLETRTVCILCGGRGLEHRHVSYTSTDTMTIGPCRFCEGTGYIVPVHTEDP